MLQFDQTVQCTDPEVARAREKEDEKMEVDKIISSVLTTTVMTRENKREAFIHRTSVHFLPLLSLSGRGGTCPAMSSQASWVLVESTVTGKSGRSWASPALGQSQGHLSRRANRSHSDCYSRARAHE